MTARYLLTKEVLHLTLRVPKNDAGFILHLIEASDNLCFATTLAVETGAGWRDLLLRAPIEWAPELRRFVEKLQETIPVSVIEDRVVKDD
ncbi:MAG: hypothetical protein ACLGG7_10455 [Bacteriovoracia bacterium]